MSFPTVIRFNDETKRYCKNTSNEYKGGACLSFFCYSNFLFLSLSPITTITNLRNLLCFFIGFSDTDNNCSDNKFLLENKYTYDKFGWCIGGNYRNFIPVGNRVDYNNCYIYFAIRYCRFCTIKVKLTRTLANL